MLWYFSSSSFSSLVVVIYCIQLYKGFFLLLILYIKALQYIYIMIKTIFFIICLLCIICIVTILFLFHISYFFIHETGSEI